MLDHISHYITWFSRNKDHTFYVCDLNTDQSFIANSCNVNTDSGVTLHLSMVRQPRADERWSHGRAPDCQSRGRWFNPTCRRFGN